MLSAWFLHPDFGRLVRGGYWESQTAGFLSLLESFVDVARTWNVKIFGNIFGRKKHCLARLEGVQKAFMLGLITSLVGERMSWWMSIMRF